MNFKDFVKYYDRPGIVVVLEGKRIVLEDDKPRLLELSKLLAENTQHIIYRSGNASGADNYFSKGFYGKFASRFEVVIPYDGHRKEDSHGFKIINIEDYQLDLRDKLVKETMKNRQNKDMFYTYIGGERNRMSIKAAYLLRDTLKILGFPPSVKGASFALFYDDLRKPEIGGTGHTINICRNNFVPFINQQIWFHWLG